MVLTGGLVYGPQGSFSQTDVVVDGSAIAAITPPAGAQGGQDVLDVSDCYVLPGFVDIHSHGCVGHDFCDADADGLQKMLAYYGQQGITSVAPATMSYLQPRLGSMIQATAPFMGKRGYGAVLRGIIMEGPFLNRDKHGAQNPEYLLNPQFPMFEELYKLAGGCIRLIDVAPELPGSLEFIRKASRLCTVSLTHTTADYDESAATFEAGAPHVTHLFNVMPPFGHRAPGVGGAAFDHAAHVELICDGLHLHPAVIGLRLVWRQPHLPGVRLDARNRHARWHL